jgi:predicted DNA-binding WGR domain protein
MYSVRVLTNNKKGYKIIKKFKTYEKAKQLFNKLITEDAGRGYFTYNEN